MNRFNIELRPCPFCNTGQQEIYTSTNDYGDTDDVRIECECGAAMVVYADEADPWEAVKRWNGRVER